MGSPRRTAKIQAEITYKTFIFKCLSCENARVRFRFVETLVHSSKLFCFHRVAIIFPPRSGFFLRSGPPSCARAQSFLNGRENGTQNAAPMPEWPQAIEKMGKLWREERVSVTWGRESSVRDAMSTAARRESAARHHTPPRTKEDWASEPWRGKTRLYWRMYPATFHVSLVTR